MSLAHKNKLSGIGQYFLQRPDQLFALLRRANGNAQEIFNPRLFKMANDYVSFPSFLR